MARKQYAVLGLGKFGASVAMELAVSGADVLAVDRDEERVSAVADHVTCAVRADVCDSTSMQNLGISNMDCVVVAITGDLDGSILGVIAAKDAGVPYVVAKAKDSVHMHILEKLGADRIIIPEQESGVRMARSISSGTFHDFIELSDRCRLVEMPPKPEWVGKSLRELNLRKRERINVIAVRRGGEIYPLPDPDAPLSKHNNLVVMVDRSDVSRLLD